MAVLRFEIKQEAVVEGNGSGKRKRRKRIIIWTSIAAVVVILVVAGALAAYSGGVKIDPSLLKPEECEIVEDLLVTAFGDARRKAEAAMQEKMQSLAGGLGLPPGLFGT